MLQLTDNNYKSVIQSGIVLVRFTAEWCGPCKMMIPVFQELSSEYEGRITVAEVDIEVSPDVTRNMGIKNIPSIFIYKNGVIVDRQLGAVPKSFLREKIEKYLR